MTTLLLAEGRTSLPGSGPVGRERVATAVGSAGSQRLRDLIGNVRHLAPFSPIALAAVVCALLAGVSVLDWSTGDEISFSVLYLLPIGIAAWRFGTQFGLMTALAAAILWFSVECDNHPSFTHPLIPVWNAAVRFAFFAIAVGFLGMLRKRRSELARDVKRQTEALAVEVDRRRALELKLAEVAAAEQMRLAHDLHDGIGQFLAGLSFRMGALTEDLAAEGSPHVRAATRLQDALATMNREIRGLNRLLGPPMTDGNDLSAALRQLVQELNALFDVDCRLEAPETTVYLERSQLEAFYRIAQESISNAIKHAGAKAVTVQLDRGVDRRVRLSVRDSGPGFTVPAAGCVGAGLGIMRHRAEIAGLRLEIRSIAGAGCEVFCEQGSP